MKYIWFALLLCVFDGLAIEINASNAYHITNTYYLESASLDIEHVIAAPDWQPRKRNHIPSQQSSLWLKLETEIQKPEIQETDIQTSALNGLYISLLSSFELYLGNQLVHRSGVVSGETLSGSKQTEIPGNIDAYIILPEAAQKPGKHTWYLRISREQLPGKYRQGMLDFNINTYDKIITQRYQQSLIPLVSLSVFFTIAIYYFCLWFGQRYPTYLAFSLLCLVMAAWLLAENWRPLFSFPYDWQGTRLWFISVCAAIFGMLLPVVFFLELRPISSSTNSLSLRWCCSLMLTQLVLFTLLHGTLSQFDLITGIFVAQGLLLSLLITLRAIDLDIAGGRWLGAALLICILAIFSDPYNYLEQWFFLLFPLVIIALLYKQSIAVKQIQESRDKALVQVESFKLQLLKTSIQPHFLLNTLTSLMEWIEQSPDTAIEMVEQLGEEFYLLNTMVDKPLVSLSEEIKLCQIHLQLMSLRLKTNFKLKAHIADPRTEIPPGILHTQIENAFSHNQFPEGEYQFDISQTFVLMTNNKNKIAIKVSFPIYNISERTGTGTGRAYIENRLQHAFEDRWQMTEQINSDLLESQISIINPVKEQ